MTVQLRITGVAKNLNDQTLQTVPAVPELPDWTYADSHHKVR